MNKEFYEKVKEEEDDDDNSYTKFKLIVVE